MMDTKGFILTYFTELEKQKIRYCVLRNIEEVVSGDAHDIDFTVEITRLQDSVNILKQIASDRGWIQHVNAGDTKDESNIKSMHFYKCDDKNRKIEIAHFDIFPVFAWEGWQMLNNEQLLNEAVPYMGIYKTSDAVESVTKLFIRLLHNGAIKDKYKPAIKATFANRKEEVIRLMEHFLPQDLAKEVAEMAISEQWESINKKRKELVSSIKSKVKKSSKIKYFICKIVRRSGIIVAFEGTDGSGKSTIIEGLPNILSNSYPKDMTDYYHWRPGFIKKETRVKDGKAVVVSDPHAKKPYGRVKSFAKFMFFNLDYILGYWMKVRIQLAKGHLVIFDRYYYDYYLDKLRYRLTISDNTLNLFKFIIPKPDVTFSLIGDAKVLYERKKEITIEEIEEQLKRIQYCAKWFHNVCIIDVNQDIDAVRYHVAKKILECGAERCK